MTNLTGKFLVLDGVRFRQVSDDPTMHACSQCVFKSTSCRMTREQMLAERDQELDCVADRAHYEVLK